MSGGLNYGIHIYPTKHTLEMALINDQLLLTHRISFQYIHANTLCVIST